jgi:hypothetical protein
MVILSLVIGKNHFTLWRRPWLRTITLQENSLISSAETVENSQKTVENIYFRRSATKIGRRNKRDENKRIFVGTANRDGDCTKSARKKLKKEEKLYTLHPFHRTR